MTKKDDMILIVDHLSHSYNRNDEKIVKTLDDISTVVGKGEFIGLIGHTGSGKSTFVQHLNGLLSPEEGSIYFHGEDVFEKGYDKKRLRSKVGLVFQYPEHQLFAETVFEDVCFGPKNIGMSRKDAELKAYEALKLVGLEDEYFYQSPFDLSGGQKRRVAIAGVLAMKPEIMILDEPTAGLDPKGKEDLLCQIKKLQVESQITIILVSHSMEDVANYVDRIWVMDKGKIIYDDSPKAVFSKYQELEKMGLRAPEVTYITEELRKMGINMKENITTVQEAKDEILQWFQLKR